MISIVIPTYKNREMLVANLRKNLHFFGENEVIIVNDDPNQSIVEDLKEFKNIILIENVQNLGFAGTVNKGVRATSLDYVMILNSDVILQDVSYEKLPAYFIKHASLFAVSFAQAEKNGSLVGRNRLFWKNGFMQHSAVSDIKRSHNGWAEGGSFVVDTSKFRSLNGFSQLFYPFYWEDIDLSYRAWKRGYSIEFNPDIEVIHHHESTISKYFEQKRIKKIAYRNQLIFIWKNITDTTLIGAHLAALPRQLVYSVLRGDWPFIAGLLEAIIRLPAVIKQRRKDALRVTRTDLEVLNLIDEK